jgi:carbon monoxide dehydrogenase subunit G
MAPIEFGGEESFTSPPERVFNVLTDFDQITRTIPDLVSSERVDASTLKCVVRPGFSFLRGTLKLTIRLADVQPPAAAQPGNARMTVDASGIGMSMRVESQLRVEPAGSGSKLVWTSTVAEAKGLIASVSPALLRAAADNVIRHAWLQVRSVVD